MKIENLEEAQKIAKKIELENKRLENWKMFKHFKDSSGINCISESGNHFTIYLENVTGAACKILRLLMIEEKQNTIEQLENEFELLDKG